LLPRASSFGYGLKKDSIVNKLDYYQNTAFAPAGAINSAKRKSSR
jgi:hypothetical protein